MAEDGQRFMGTLVKRNGNAGFEEKIVLMDYIGIEQRSMIFRKTLIWTNWCQIVTFSELILGVMGFTNMIQKQPQDK